MLSVALGLIIGVLAGLIPGVHTNLIAVVVATLDIPVWQAISFLVSVAVARSIVDAIPSVFLGATDGNVMAILPGHKLLKKGYGVEAVKFYVVGGILGTIVGVGLIPIAIVVFPFLSNLFQPWLFWMLLALVLLLIIREGNRGAVLVFALSGLLGMLALNSVRDPLFPLLSGLYGASGLLLALFERVDIPPQYDADMLRLKPGALSISVITGVLAASIVTLFPGLSPSQAAALAQVKRQRSTRFLVLLGALGTVDVLISLVTFFVLNKTRNGAVVVIEKLAGPISTTVFIACVAIACIAAGFASIATIYLSKWYAQMVGLIDYVWLSAGVLVLLTIMSVILSGWLGLLVFITASIVGILAPLLGVSRSHSMGCLLVPTLLWLW